MGKYFKFLVALSIVFTGCTKDFLDVNTDPNNPTKAPLYQLLPNAQVSMAYALSMNGGYSDRCAFYMQQLSDRGDLWGLQGSGATWSYNYSSPLKDLEVLIAQAEESDNLIYAGIGKILKAYQYSILVDLFGDIPFSEACRAPEIMYPKWDADEDIYPQLITLINNGIKDLRNTESVNALKPTTDDLVYAGDVVKWIRAANTIKLKLYNNIRLVEDVSAEVDALVTADSLINSGGDFQVKFGTSSNPDDRNQGFGEYETGQKSLFISPYFLEILKGNQPVFAGCIDPRVKYYFYNQLSTTATGSRENNKIEYRDGGFVSIYPGSIGKYRDGSLDGSQTVLGIYPVGGRYDQGDAKKVTGASGSGAAPYRFLTYADRLFIQAELKNENVLTAGAQTTRDLYVAAVAAAFVQVDAVVTLAKLSSQTVPVIATLAATTTYKAAIMTKWDDVATTQAKRTEYIVTQKWISSFGCNHDQFTDYRRTGYPKLFDPNDPLMAPGGEVVAPVGSDGSPIPVQGINPVAVAWPWPQTELSLNPKAPVQKNPYTDKVFWDL